MSSSGSSIIRRLVLVTLIAGLVTGILGAVIVQVVERRNLVADAHARNLSSAVRTAALVDSRVDTLTAQLKQIASRPEISTFDPAASDELAVALRASGEIDTLVLYDKDGNPAAASAAASVIDLDELSRWSGTEAGSAAILNADREDSTVQVAAPVDDPPGTHVGWLVAHTSLAQLASDASAQMARPGALAGVVAEDGTIVAHREFDRVVAGEVLPVAELFSGDRRTATIERNGRTLLLGAARLTAMPGWTVVEQPQEDALAPLRERAAAHTLVLLAVLGSIVAVVVLAGRRLLRPLGPLADAVERLGAGERGVRVESGAPGEVAVLADGFNRMARSLEERQDELRRAELSTRRSEERLRLMVEGVTDYAIVLLGPDRRIRTWNTGARRLHGYSPKEALGRPLADMFDPEEPPPDPLAQVESAGRARVEGWCRRADGERFWAGIAATSLEDDEGAPYGFAVIVHDLTGRRAAREAMEAALQREQQAASELRRANELKDEFLAIAAHEIRTPLSVILGASRLLGREGGKLTDEETARVRAMIETHADDMRAIVDRLLDFTRLQAGKVRLSPEPVDLRSEVDDHLRSLERHLANHDVVLDVAPVAATVDRAALHHIVTNLVSNAAKFSPAGSTVTVRCHRDEKEVVVSVADEGVGVPTGDQERIFELFRQASRDVVTARGTGVGLAIVKRYVELLEGSITVESVPDEGSVFTVRLPQRGEPAPHVVDG